MQKSLPVKSIQSCTISAAVRCYFRPSQETGFGGVTGKSIQSCTIFGMKKPCFQRSQETGKQGTSTWLDCSRLMSDFSVRSREFIKACFCRKTHRLLPLYVLGNRSKTLLLLIICKRTDSPTASRLRSEGTSLKSHRLNINSSRDRICTFFRFRMDMDHYVLSSLASLLFPEP